MAPNASQYLLPDGVGLDAALERLKARFVLAVGPTETVARTFYDTFDGRLHAAGIALIGVDGQLVAGAAPTYTELAVESGIDGERVFVDDLPSGPLRELVAPLVDVRALLPIARTRGDQQRLAVLNDDEKTVVRLRLEAARAVVADRGEVGLRARVHAIGVRGYDRALARVRRTLDAEGGGFERSDARLDDEAVRAAGGRPGGWQSKLDLDLDAGGPAAAGAALALREMLGTIEQTLPGTVDDIDTEFLHDLRVAVRRTRSVQRQLAAAFPRERLRWFRDEFRWLGQITGPTRDLDVLLLDFARLRGELVPDKARELAPVGELLARRREAARVAMAAALESDRTRRALDDWAAFLGSPPSSEAVGRRRLAEVAGRRIRAVYRDMREAGAQIVDDSPAELLHDLRKQGKELRYLLEIFAGLFPAEAVRPTVKTLKALQETLGQFQDRDVQAAALRGLGSDLAVAAGGPDALLALGRVLERIDAESGAARGEFRARFEGFVAPPQRALVREAFR